MLEVPDELAAASIQRQRRVRVEAGILGPCPRIGLQQRRRVVGVARPEENQVTLWIVATRGPHASAKALLERVAIPAVAAGLPRSSDRIEPPVLLPGRH